MAEHETCLGASDDWYTPPAIFDALGLTFDLDPCSPGAGHWVPARKIYTKPDDLYGSVQVGPQFVREQIGGFAVGHADDGTLDTSDGISPKLPPSRPTLRPVQ